MKVMRILATGLLALLALLALSNVANSVGIITQAGPRLRVSGGGGSGLDLTCTAPTLDESGVSASIDHYVFHISQNVEDWADEGRHYDSSGSTCEVTVPDADISGWSAVHAWVQAVSPADALSSPVYLGDVTP